MTEEADEAGRRLLAYAAELNERVERCHEEVGCPRCFRPRGEKCVRVIAASTGLRVTAETLKHPHRERWTQVVPAR